MSLGRQALIPMIAAMPPVLALHSESNPPATRVPEPALPRAHSSSLEARLGLSGPPSTFPQTLSHGTEDVPSSCRSAAHRRPVQVPRAVRPSVSAAE